MNDKLKMFIGNEEVVCSNEFTISEEMLSASSTILNNCYPKSWELTKNYISNFYYPEDYSKLIIGIGNGNYQYGNTEYSVLEVSGKNLFDEQYENGTINATTGVNENSSTIIRTKNFQSIKPSQDYTLILPNEVTGIIIYYYNNGTYINYQQPTISNHKVSFTTRANSNQIKWRFNSNYTTLINQTMLYEGTQATEYEPYNQTNLQYETNIEKKWDKLYLEGNSYQDIRSGKNLWLNDNYITAIPTANYTITETGFTFTRNSLTGGKYIAKTINVESGKTYTFSANITASPSSDCYIVVYRGNVYGTMVTASNTGVAIFTATANETLYFTFIINSGLQTANVSNIQVEQSSTKTSYELYGVQPSPDYPSTIQNVGYQNLFKITQVSGTYNELTFTKIDDNTFRIQGTTTGANRSISLTNLLPPLIQGEQYTYSVEVLEGTFVGSLPIAIYNADNTIRYNYFNLTSSNLAQTNTIIANNGIQGIAYFITSNNTVDVTLRVMLTKSSYKLPFIYYGKYGIEVKNYGKNLFNDNNIRLGIAWNNASNTARAIALMPVKPSTNYTISFNSISGLEGVYAFGREYITDSTRTMGNYDITGTRTLTTTANTHYLGLQFNKTNITKQDIINCLFQVEEGNGKTTYEPYKENSQLYVLDEPLRAIGDVKDTFTIENNKLTIIRKIGSRILNGSENWGTIGNDRYYVSFPDKRGLTTSVPCLLISNYFKATENAGGNVPIGYMTEGYYTIANTNVFFNFNGSNNDLAGFKTWLSTHNTEVLYVLDFYPTYTRYPVEIPSSYEGINNVFANVGNVGSRVSIDYYWRNFEVLFSGVVKNSGEISLNPREPHYCSLQVLDYKTFLSESNCLDFVISNKTIIEAIQMVVNAVSGYGFVVGNIGIAQGNDIIGAYSTLNQSAYDVLQYLANISGSRWRARYVDSSTMAIDFYDPDLLPQANDILYTQQYYEDNNIVNLSFNYGTRDYRNKQIVLSDEIYGDIDYRENLYADGYQTTFLLQENIGVVNSVSVNGVAQEVITKEEKDNGVDGDFWYTPGKDTLDSKKTLSVNSEIIVEYTPLIAGRQIVYNSDEVQRVANNTDTIGVIARYETRNDILSSQELNQIGQTYINYKGKAEVILTIRTKEKDLFNIGEVAYFNAPITELQQNYMVKAKNIEYIVINGTPTLFYEYQLTSSYNNEKAINYFDNQRNKAQGNIELGKSITRNIDIENKATIIWQNLSVSEVAIEPTNTNVLNSSLNSPLVD